MTNIETILEYVNNAGGCVQFHAIGEIFVSTLDKNYQKSDYITELVVDAIDNKGRVLDLGSIEAVNTLVKVYNEIQQYGNNN